MAIIWEIIFSLVWLIYYDNPNLCFELILLIILNSVSDSNKLNWNENAGDFFKNVFIVLFLCSGCEMLAERLGPIFWNKELKLLAMSSLLSNLSPLITKHDGIFVTFIAQVLNGGPSLFYIWYIFVKFWFIVKYTNSIYISLEDAIVILDVFFFCFIH